MSSQDDPLAMTPAAAAATDPSGWWGALGPTERRTFATAWAGWSLDSFDVNIYSFVIPSLMVAWGMTSGQAGLLGTSALFASALGGCVAGMLCDRYGRVLVLQITIAWFAFFTFLSGFTTSFEQLLVVRCLQGFGFGGEWAAGAVLISEIVKPAHRGRVGGLVQSGWAVGWGLAAVVAAVVLTWFGPDTGWKVMFWIGILPALLIVYIRRNIPEPAINQRATPTSAGEMLSIFRAPLRSRVFFAALVTTGGMGGAYSIITWLPTFLRTERQLSIAGASGYVALATCGAFCGFVLAGFLADAIGRKRTVLGMALLAAGLVCVYTVVPITQGQLLAVGFLVGFATNGIFGCIGAFLSELFPTRVRGTAQGFVYNAGRGIGALFPALVGFISPALPLGQAMGYVAVGCYALVLVGLLGLPETRGRDLSAVS